MTELKLSKLVLEMTKKLYAIPARHPNWKQVAHEIIMRELTPLTKGN